MSDDPTVLNRTRMALYLERESDAVRCREIAATCQMYGLPHRRVGLVERGFDVMRARAELRREAFGEAAISVAPFPLLIADPMMRVDYSESDAELDRIATRKSWH